MSLGSDVFHAQIADRLFMFLCSLLSRSVLCVSFVCFVILIEFVAGI